jgi:2'-5' RNA ligase
VNLPACTGDQLRIGVAVEVPEPYGPMLQQARAVVGDPLAASIPPHITMLGPATLEPEELEEVEEHLRRVAAAQRPFMIRLRGTGTFRPVSDVVFVQVAEGIAECEALEARVRTGPLSRDRRFLYHPHVTVAHDVPAPALDEAFEKLAGFEAVFRVAALHMYEHGVDEVWRLIRTFEFGVPAPVGADVADTPSGNDSAAG